MVAQVITNAFEVIFDINGEPLENGYVYIGTAGLDAQTNQIQAYWDETLSVPATQPIRTISGFLSQSGSPGKLYVDADDYSLTVLNKNTSLVTSSLNAVDSISAANVNYIQAGANAVMRTIMDRLRDTVSVFDFGDPFTDVGACVNAATNQGALRIFFPSSEAYVQSTAFTTNQEVHLYTVSPGIYGFNPVLITKDDDFAHIETNATFSSYGITFTGSGVVGSSSGIVLHGKFEFYGSVTSQPNNGLECTETVASHNLNGSVLAGGFASNGGHGILIENTVVSNSNNIDLNVFTIIQARCNSNTGDGIRFSAGLYHEWLNVRCDNNGGYGLNILGTNAVQFCKFRIYLENNVTGEISVTETATNNVADNQFFQTRGVQASDIITANGNILFLGASLDGIIRNTSQPYCAVLLSADAANVTGNGTVYTIAYNSEIKDTQGDFDNTTYTYTARAGGAHSFTGNVRLTGLSASHTRCELNLVTSNRTYLITDFNVGAVRSSANTYIINWAVIADMDANDTAVVRLEINGSGADDVTVGGDPTNAQTAIQVNFLG